MSFYEWVCRDCSIYWEEEHPIGTAPSKQNCPKCEDLCNRKWDTPPAVHFKGAGWSGVNKKTGYNKTGGSDEVNKRLQDGCNERMESGWQHYAKYEPSDGYLQATNARKLSHQEVKNKLDASRKVTAEVYDKAGMNPYEKTNKPQ
tara:strand:+ start:67 stop:501 length:435 start_codon:yes stop_codon:yes gene_type:complete